MNKARSFQEVQKQEEPFLLENICKQCGNKTFEDTLDYENDFISCVKCGNVQFGELNPIDITTVRQYGKTVYDPCERFMYWVQLAQGDGKITNELRKKVDSLSTLSELKTFMMQKENRKHRKFYPTILKEWDEEFVPPLSNTEIDSLRVNFMHLLRHHSKNRGKNPKTGRKKSLPHYIFLITTFLNKIGREDLASNFLPMKCIKIQKEYEGIINHLF